MIAVLLLPGCVGSTPSVGGAASDRAMRLLIVQSADTPAFAAVTQELIRRWPSRPATVTLSADDSEDTLMARVRARPPAAVIAIGLPAAMAARGLRNKVIFCQVFNYEEAALLSPSMKGVSAIPSIEAQFRLWKRIDPRLERVGVMVGPHLNDVIRAARAAARANAISLTVVPVRSDMEVRYAFRRLGAAVQGLWLLPDNRVLSRSVLREVLSYSYREGKPVLAPSLQLLTLGALMSVEPDPGDVAERVLERVRAGAGRSDIPGPEVIPLTHARVRINRVVAKRLGLRIPSELKELVYAPR